MEEEKFSPCTPTILKEPPPMWYQPTITEILPPPNANDTQHHIQFISSSVGTMIHVVYS